MARQPTGQIIERQGVKGRTFSIRFPAYGRRRFQTLGVTTRAAAEKELANVLADVRRGIWREPDPEPVEPEPVPTFHAFASEWVTSREAELKPRSIEGLKWALEIHLLPYFASFQLADITAEHVDRYKLAKVADGSLMPRSINKTLSILASILDQAVEYGHLASNPARGKRRRLKAAKPHRTWLEPDEVRDLLDAASGSQRAMLATMILGGLRVGEACALRWRHVDLPGAKLRVEQSKTDAGRRVVDVSPWLLDELKAVRVDARFASPDDFVFPTAAGRAKDRAVVRRMILAPAVKRANEARAKVGLRLIIGTTNHSLRRTFASLLYEAEASPAYVMSQLGHSSSALALEVYAQKMTRERDTGVKMDALIRGADWAETGRKDDGAAELLSETATEDAL